MTTGKINQVTCTRHTKAVVCRAGGYTGGVVSHKHTPANREQDTKHSRGIVKSTTFFDVSTTEREVRPEQRRLCPSVGNL